MVKKEEIKEQEKGKETQPEKGSKEKGTITIREFDKESWIPKTSIGMKVKSGEIDNIDYILDNRFKILESEIVDILMPNLSTELLLVGQAKGKFGGGQRRVFRQTQKKTREGNKPRFGTFAIVGNEDGYLGIGYGKSKETVPAREKAMRNAKLNIIKIRRGCGSWQCGCKNAHSVPFTVEGKCGSVTIRLIPAPTGIGLCVEGECRKILKIAGIKDVWSQTSGQTRTKLNLINACFSALKRLTEIKIQKETAEKLNIIEGSVST
ncbi:30S ribosomal protein S5 [archaeon AH-315-M20]|nr:30S ribosomal protein S5 [archaeon AH-315-M20]